MMMKMKFVDGVEGWVLGILKIVGGISRGNTWEMLKLLFEDV
jgi:hypothetical protein